MSGSSFASFVLVVYLDRKHTQSTVEITTPYFIDAFQVKIFKKNNSTQLYNFAINDVIKQVK